MEIVDRTLALDGEDDNYSSDKVLPMVYIELRRLAAIRLTRETGYQTLQPTALVHEAWLRMAGGEETTWKSKGHFYGAASQAMRRILVERARGKARIKRKAPSDAIIEEGLMENDDHIIMIHDCLTRMEKSDPESAKVVLLKFYGGLSNQEIAGIIGSSLRSVERQWMFAKAKLFQMILAQEQTGDDASA